MNLVVATIPEDPAELAGWLERRLVGLELDGLVAELAAIHRSAGLSPPLDQVLGDRFEQVRAGGLSCLSGEQIRQLLTRPLLLLELQERILTASGPYWDQVARTMPMMHLKVEEGRKLLPSEVLANARSGSGRVRPVSVTLAPAPATPAERTKPAYGVALLASLATAAMMLLAIGLWQWNQPVGPKPGTAVAWGWQKPDAMKEGVNPSAYLEGLADAAEDWSAKKPANAEELARRIGEMRIGCSRLILASHRPLSPDDQKWLLGKCKDWAIAFDKALTELESSRDVAKVQKQMDDTVDRLTKALREQARQAA